MAGLLPLSRFDDLPLEDQAEIMEYLREADMIVAISAKMQEEKAVSERLRKR